MIIDSQKYNGLCSCGKTHTMDTEFCVIEKGCLKEIKKYLDMYGITGYSVAVYDENTYKATADRHPKVDMEIVLPAEDLHANEYGVALVLDRLPKETGYLIAIGSGTVHDIVRYCANERGINFISSPTAATVAGFCSSVAAMTWHGCKKTFPAISPKLVVADIDVIKAAPIKLAKSGFGDIVGKYVALVDWKVAKILLNEYYCDRIVNMTLDATKAVLESIDGIIAGEETAFEKLAYGLILSGLAMQLAGNSRPASGAEHHISHLIEMKPEGMQIDFDALHGEKVGVGTLLVLELYQSFLSKPTPDFKDFTNASREIMEKVFGEDRADDKLDENKNDTAVSLKSDFLKEKWQEILDELTRLPSAQKIKQIYEKYGILSSLEDIGVSSEYADYLLKNAPLVRCRFTLLRLISRSL